MPLDRVVFLWSYVSAQCTLYVNRQGSHVVLEVLNCEIGFQDRKKY